MYNSNSHVVYKLHVKLEHFSLCFFKLLSKNPCFLHFYWILLKIIKVVWISQRFNQMLLNNVTQILRVERHGLILAEKVHIMCILCISGRDIYMFILCKTSAFFCLDKGGGEESGPSGQTGEARASNPEDTEGSQLNSETSSTSADSPPKQLPDQISFFSGNPCVEIVYGIMHLYKTKWVTGPKFSALKFREMNMLMFRVQTIVDGHIFVLIFVSFLFYSSYCSKMTSLTEDVRRSAMVCILTVPATMTSHDLMKFMAPFNDVIDHMKIIRDSTPNQYMVLVKFQTQVKF